MPDVETLKEKVERVIEERIRPALRFHGGDIRLIEVTGSDVKVRLLGACCFCPSAQSTMEDVVTGSLKEELGDEIGRVILWDAISDELLDFARDFFKRKQAQSQ